MANRKSRRHPGKGHGMSYADVLAQKQSRSDWLNKMTEEDDEVYAYEKLRQEASRCSGMDITYLYEHEILEAQRRAEEET